MRTTSLAVLALATAACSGPSQEAPVRSVAQPVAAPAPYRASPSGAASAAVAPSPGGGARVTGPAPSYAGGGSYAAAPRAPAATGSLNWLHRIAEAQAAARASGKLILVGSTKPGCSLCDKFAHTTAPQCWGRLGQVAVPYMYDITRPEDARVDGTLRANLRGAALMPLVGFLTPDLQWVHGFSGPRSVEEFLGDIESARRIYPVHAAALPKEALITGAATAMVNEYGENEWSAPADWPMPEDALGPVAAAAPPPAAPPAVEPVAAAAPTPAPTVEPTPAPVEPAPVVAAEAPPAPAPSADPAAGWSQPASATLSSTLSSAIAASPAPLTSYAPPPAPAPVAAPLTSGPASAMTDDAAQSTLSEAFGHIRAGRFDDARAALRRVSQALPNTALGREADRGAVAVYNARRISTATSEQRTTLAERARRDFAASMWADLF